MNNLEANESQIGGSAARVPATVTLEEGAALLQSQGGTLRAEVQIIRKATGKIENYTLTMGDDAKES